MSASSFATQTLTHKTQERVKYVTSLYASRTTPQVVETRPSCREKSGSMAVARHVVALDGRPPGKLATMTTLHYADERCEIHKVVVGPIDNNVFVLRCTETGDAVLLDAANEHERLLDLARSLGVRSVLETHGHWDHIQAIPEMRDAGYQVHVTAEDADMLPSYDQILDDDAVVPVGRLRLRTIHTPGHTPGSMSFLIEGSPVLFSGDTLFPGGPGATSFPGGDFPTIIRSIDRKLLTLPADTLVLPGHGDDTTIGSERPHLQEWIDRGW
jgi:glyoxylase-like metal-dependent hydrolase (beta-lactamase superfamily II)